MTSYTSSSSQTKKMPQETCQFSASCFREKKLPTGTLLKEHARFLYTGSDTSSVCSSSLDSLGPSTWFDRPIFDNISKMPKTNPTAEIAHLHTSRSSYKLSEQANETVDTLNKEFIIKVNEAITEGQTPPKTKKFDIILRVAAALHVINHVAFELLQQRQPTQPPEEIEMSTLL